MEELKVGDFVTIKPFDWYDKNKDAAGNIYKECYNSFTPGMSKYCGEVAMITHVIWGYYHINLDSSYYNWELYMFNLPEEINNKNNNMELKHKIGDVIQIKSRVWYNINKNEYGDVISSEGDAYFTSSLAKYCGHQVQIISIEKLGDKSYYKLDIDKPLWNWEDWMFENSLKSKEPKIVAVLSKEELKKKLTGFKTQLDSVTNAIGLHDLIEELFDFDITTSQYLNSSYIIITEDEEYYFYDCVADYDEVIWPFISIDEILGYKIETPVLTEIFKPFDKVLVRDDDSQEWIPAFFKYFNKADDFPYNTMDGEFYKQCIPYEGNEDKLAYLYEG